MRRAGYSIVGHRYLEQLCSVPVRRSRTKDLVWLVYRHTVGRTGGRDTGIGWSASGADIAAALGIKRANAQRCRSEALDLGLISAGPGGELYVGTVRTIRRNPVVGVDPVGSSLDPVGSTLDPVGSSLDPVGSKKGGGRGAKKRIRRKERCGRELTADPGGSSFDRLLSLLSEGRAERRDIEGELLRLVQLEETGDERIRVDARNMRAVLLNTIEGVS